MGCHPGENGIYIMEVTFLNDNEVKYLKDFMDKNPGKGFVIISNNGSGIGVNKDVLLLKDYFRLSEEHQDDPEIPYTEYHKMSADITGYSAW